MITWLSTKSPLRMLDPPISSKMEQYLRDNQGIDSALLALDLGLGPDHVEARQRRLGLRKLSVPGRRRD
jgi:hypothetical protein